MDILNFENTHYPLFQSQGNASQFAIPYAKHFCKGFGYDIGCMKKEWSFPGSTPIDLSFDDDWEANNLPNERPNYIFSSHCLEHVDDWVETLNYWVDYLLPEGVIFLYLPDFSQRYWRPWNNRKHKHVLSAEILEEYFISKGFINIFSSGVDLNNSFMIVGKKISQPNALDETL